MAVTTKPSVTACLLSVLVSRRNNHLTVILYRDISITLRPHANSCSCKPHAPRGYIFIFHGDRLSAQGGITRNRLSKLGDFLSRVYTTSVPTDDFVVSLTRECRVGVLLHDLNDNKKGTVHARPLLLHSPLLA